MTSVWENLKQRNVIRVAVAYAVVAWLVLQIADVILNNIAAPSWVFQTILLVLAIGFPVALIFSWAFELTSEGIKKDRDGVHSKSANRVVGRKLDFLIIGVLSVALAMFSLDKFVWTESTAPVRTASSEERSIAVLPFVNMSSDEEQEYFSDGLAEELLNLLASIPELDVTSRSSAFYYKGKDIRSADIGKELNVGHILEGSVRRSGDTVRIAAQLIDVSSDVQVWSDTWDRTFEDIFAIQDEIATAVVGSLRINLLGEMPHVPETLPEAYTLYLQAGQTFNLQNADGMFQAERLLKRALELDNEFIPAWSLLIRTYFRGAAVGAWHPLEAYPMVRSSAEEILEMDADNVVAILALADMASRADYDYESARVFLERASELDPENQRIRERLVSLPDKNSNMTGFISFYEQRVLSDPAEVGSMYRLGQAYFLSRRFDESEEVYRRTISLSPGSSGSHFYLGAVLLLGERYDEALAQMDLEVRDGYAKTGRALVYQAMGDTERAGVELEELIEIGYRWTYQIAAVYAFMNDADNAFLWLDRAYERRDTSLGMLEGDPFMDNVRDDPRYFEMLRSIGRQR